MATGKVKWFNNAKGYGFVRPDCGGEDLFVHYSYICMDGYRSLKAGQQVTYDIREAPKGLHAVNINIIGTDQSSAPTEENQTESANDAVGSVELHPTLHAEAV
ncbi:DNA-binding protein [Ketobacter sp. MCCC 1A13808]|uniref:cold shock domain-containing protein n=1 Tax=Ketobacter sp. MCCC 1A13808 TaxID=2602738 RepID=UPI000F0F5CA3|nr:cold shock domain-containing protein [Ketobacter sp. MCCC 1A13808]MVF10593.1 DNA-binding protein [Ketobacter sp. MCCC 1A13808]RLP56016.1 MAG: DNA-binding protein [Ketobacter sp.]